MRHPLESLVDAHIPRANHRYRHGLFHGRSITGLNCTTQKIQGPDEMFPPTALTHLRSCRRHHSLREIAQVVRVAPSSVEDQRDALMGGTNRPSVRERKPEPGEARIESAS